MNKPRIIDVSSNQDHPIDWAAVKKSGVKGVILKATQGTTYVNSYFEGDLKGCRDAGLPVVAYHFAMFTNAIAEARAFHRVAGRFGRALDIETSSNLAWANDFLGMLQECGGLAHDQTMLYGSESSLPRKGLISLLWVADYGVTTPGRPCACWQFTETGKVPGIANPVDVSYWMGTAQQFDSFFSAK